MQSVSILGSTGTIGINTLEVISAHPDKYSVFALTANTNIDKLYEQCKRYSPRYAVLRDSTSASELRERLAGFDIEVLEGESGLTDVASAVDVDVVMCAIVGAAGLNSSLAAVKASKRVLLANKEALVMSGEVFMRAVREHDATLLPIDSEHNAIFQCLPDTHSKQLVSGTASLHDLGIDKILLTGSGGPFRERNRDSLGTVTPQQAIAHPNWSMGPKISVDSATMMNKGLELIEAGWLFSATANDIEIIVHPQSIIHSMVQYRDGSVLAQLGQPDMKTPIAYGLGFPERIAGRVEPLNFADLTSLTFEPANEQRFPALRLARESMTAGGTAATVLNAANEVAVAAFLNNRLGFLEMNDVLEETLDSVSLQPATELAVILEADQQARLAAQNFIEKVA